MAEASALMALLYGAFPQQKRISLRDPLYSRPASCEATPECGRDDTSDGGLTGEGGVCEMEARARAPSHKCGSIG